MKRMLEIPIVAIIVSVMFVFTLFLSAKYAWSSPIYRYMDMPSDAVISFPDFPNTFQSSLTSYGISTSSPAGNNYVANFYIPPSTTDDVAPFGNAIYLEANTFTFSSPVFAAGFTFITTESANNIANISYEVRAYDKHNNLIENAFASSFTIYTGGPRHFYIGGSSIGRFAATYAGIWTDTRIYSVSLGGIRPSDGALMAAYGSFSFSDTPLHGSCPVPEPATMLLLASGLVGLAGIRREFRQRWSSSTT